MIIRGERKVQTKAGKQEGEIRSKDAKRGRKSVLLAWAVERVHREGVRRKEGDIMNSTLSTKVQPRKNQWLWINGNRGRRGISSSEACFLHSS